MINKNDTCEGLAHMVRRLNTCGAGA